MLWMEASDRTKQAGILARRSAPFRPSHGSPAMAYSDQRPAHSDLIAQAFTWFPFLYFIYRIKANIAICFDPARNIHLSCSFFNKQQYIILCRNWQPCFYKFPLIFFFVWLFVNRIFAIHPCRCADRAWLCYLQDHKESSRKRVPPYDMS